GKKISEEELGGAHVHNTTSGNAHLRAQTEEEALDMVRALLAYLPRNYKGKPPITSYQVEDDHYRKELMEIVPYDTTKPYDMKKVINEIVDTNSFLELHKEFAKNIIVGFARMNGQPVGLVCNNPRYMAGGIDIDASDKAARFIRFCDAFNVPIITLEDVTGFMPGT